LGLQNILLHADWEELQYRLEEDRKQLRQMMDEAPNWDTFIAARATRNYLDILLNLPKAVSVEKDDLEAEQAAVNEPLPPPDYEID